MTEEELSKFYHLQQEIADLNKRKKEIEETGGISGVKYREVDVMSTRVNKTILDKLSNILDKLTERRISALEEYMKIERYIESVEDIEIRRIMQYRYLDLKKWKEIDKIMHYAEDYSKIKYNRYKKSKLITFDNPDV